MWSEKLKNGNVRYVERFEHPLTGKMIKLSVTMEKDTRSNRKIAESTLQDKYEQKFIEVLSSAKKDQLTLSNLVDLYRADQKQNVSASTYIRNYHAAESLMRILGRDTLVDRLSAGYVRKQFTNQNESPGTTNERITRFKALIRWGYNNDYISDIRWIDKLKNLRNDEKQERLHGKYLEAGELKKLLASMKVDKWRFIAELTALSGLRAGEAIALELTDVDTTNRVIHVTKTYDPINQIVTSPKTKTSVRDVYMQDELLKLCRHIKSYMAREKLSQGYRTRLLICDGRGEHVDYYAYNKCLRETAERVLGRSITSHYMRHTHVALMAERGIPLDDISRRLGHANSKITREIYFHVTENLKAQENERIRAVKIL